MYSRFTAIFTPADASAPPQRLITHDRDYLLAEPERELELPVDEREFAQAAWAETVPTGNARVRLSWEVQRLFLSVAQAEAYARDLEELLARCPQGSLLLLEAWHAGMPTRVTRWQACATAFSSLIIHEPDEALPFPHDLLEGEAALKLSYEFALSDPVRIDPFSRPTQ